MKSSSWFSKLTQGLLALGGGLLLVVLILQVTFRYVLEIPLFGMEELARLLAIWLYFIAGTYALVVGGHICSDIRDLLKISLGVTRFIDFLVQILTIVASLLIAWFSSRYAWWVYESGELTPGLWWPRYITVSAAAFGGIAMTIVSVIQLIKSISKPHKKKDRH